MGLRDSEGIGVALGKTVDKLMLVHEKDQLPIVWFEHVRDWEGWLAVHGEKEKGVWLRLGKKGSGFQTLDYAEAVEGALCYGWIDGIKKTYDAVSWVQRFSPRKPGSVWSQINQERVARMVAEGRMRSAGLKTVEVAKKNGRWDAAYGSLSKMEVPEDLVAALEESRRAKEGFEGLTKSQRYMALFRIVTAKKAETRAKRVEELVALLERGEKPG